MSSDASARIGAEQVMVHPWFDGIDWDTLMEQKSLFVPKIDDITDTSYFNGESQLQQQAPRSSANTVNLCL
jgi:hypothetical protein